MKNPIESKLNELIPLFRARGWRLGLAESCTGGLLSSWITMAPGVSEIYQGAVVSYGRSIKVGLLQVKESTILALGEVSEPVAMAMARGARDALHCHWSVAITGVAGPGGGSVEKPVGTVCFAVSGPGFERALTHHFDSRMERHEIQHQSAIFAFDLLLSALR